MAVTVAKRIDIAFRHAESYLRDFMPEGTPPAGYYRFTREVVQWLLYGHPQIDKSRVTPYVKKLAFEALDEGLEMAFGESLSRAIPLDVHWRRRLL